MTKTNLLGTCEMTINDTLRRLTTLEGLNKKALENEFKEWIRAIESENQNYEILYMNKINY